VRGQRRPLLQCNAGQGSLSLAAQGGLLIYHIDRRDYDGSGYRRGWAAPRGCLGGIVLSNPYSPGSLSGEQCLEYQSGAPVTQPSGGKPLASSSADSHQLKVAPNVAVHVDV
jgi:hypothetical protein